MGAPFTAASTVADKALLVLTPDPVALRDGKIVADRLLAGGRPQSAVRLVMNRVRRESFGKNAAVADLDECIDTVGVQSFSGHSPKAVFCSWPGPTARYRPLRIPPLWPDRPWQSVCAGSASRLPFNILYSAAKDGGIYL